MAAMQQRVKHLKGSEYFAYPLEFTSAVIVALIMRESPSRAHVVQRAADELLGCDKRRHGHTRDRVPCSSQSISLSHNVRVCLSVLMELCCLTEGP